MPLKLTRRPGSPFIYLRGTVRGLSIFESTGVGERDQAEAIRIRRETELLDRSIHGDALSRTFAEAALSYMQAGGEAAHLTPLIKRLGKRAVGTIGQAEIEGAAKALLPSAGPATRNRRIFTPAVAVLHHAARLKWCDKPVIARPRQPAGRVRWITHAEAEALIAAAGDHLKPIVIFLLSTGARLSEALYLEWRDVDLGRAQVVFVDTKNGERRGVPLHPRALAALANLPHREGAVFRRPVRARAAARGGKAGRGLGAAYARREGGGGQLSTAWASMCRRAGIVDFTPHDCRHTWATWHYRENRDISALMEAGGWKSVDMVMRYAHANTGHLAASIGRVWGEPALAEVVARAKPVQS